MSEDVINFFVTFGHLIWDGLCRFKIPGTDWSAMSLFLGILLLGFGVKLLRVVFNGLSLGGGVNAAAGAARATKDAVNRHSD